LSIHAPPSPLSPSSYIGREEDNRVAHYYLSFDALMAALLMVTSRGCCIYTKGGKGNTRTAATEASKYLKTTPLVSLVSFFICSPSYLLPSFWLRYVIIFVRLCVSTLCVCVCIYSIRRQREERGERIKVAVVGRVWATITRASDLRVHRRPLRVVNIVFPRNIFPLFFYVIFFLLSVSSQMLKEQRDNTRRKPSL
jgi:4-amino-4-deoxy-L-arabinose transferase-like glycosyltransferase